MNTTAQPTPRNSQPLHVGPLAPTKIYCPGEHGPTEVATTLLQGDARRLVLCWNACTGASNTALETITNDGGGIAQVLSTMMDEIAGLKAAAAMAASWHYPIPTPDDLTYLNGVTEKRVHQRIVVERAIIRRAATDLIAAGYRVAVHDGEDVALEHSDDLTAVMAAIMSTDEDSLLTFKQQLGSTEWTQDGWIKLIYGNTGHDVISDYTTNLETVLKGANDMADAIGEYL